MFRDVSLYETLVRRRWKSQKTRINKMEKIKSSSDVGKEVQLDILEETNYLWEMSNKDEAA